MNVWGDECLRWWISEVMNVGQLIFLGVPGPFAKGKLWHKIGGQSSFVCWRQGGWSNQAKRASRASPVKSCCQRPAIKLSHWSSCHEASDQALSLAEGKPREFWLVSGQRGQGSQLGGGWPEGAVGSGQGPGGWPQPVGLGTTSHKLLPQIFPTNNKRSGMLPYKYFNINMNLVYIYLYQLKSNKCPHILLSFLSYWYPREELLNFLGSDRGFWIHGWLLACWQMKWSFSWPRQLHRGYIVKSVCLSGTKCIHDLTDNWLHRPPS